jgi:type II secretion system GspH-like protein
MSTQSALGHSYMELMFVMGLFVTVTGIALPQTLTGLDDLRARGATQYISARLHQARSEAVMRSADVAIQFAPSDQGYTFAAYVDGNRNGVRTREIETGVDRRLGAIARLGDSFSGVEFGTVADLPSIDPDGPTLGGDPIRLGPSGFATFTALGTARPGSVYIRSRRGHQYAVRILGVTGRTRMLRFDLRTRQWRPL